MASQGVAANSRLAEMQIKFQKKQMMEREQKKLAMTSGNIPGDISPASKTTIGNGKVRQMFDDRRRGVGIDRSHPLRPIAGATGTSKHSGQQLSTSKRLAEKANIVRRSNTALKQSPTSIICTSVNNGNNSASNESNVFNGNSNNIDELDNLENETFPKEFSSLSLNSTHVVEINNNEECSMLGSTVLIDKKSNSKSNGIKLNPLITKKSPIPATKTSPQHTNSVSGSRLSILARNTTNNTKPYPHKAASQFAPKSVKVVGIKGSNSKPATFVLSVKPPPRISTPPPGMGSCQHCQRHFLEERLNKHEEVCKKMTSKKRKIFDASKHRVRGTEAEKYLRKGKNSSVSKPVNTTVAANSQNSTNSSGKKSNWRKKHEEFITAIREAKKVQAYLAKGGKLSDLPPPPPSENPDYIQCPHCSRRFNESAAERHIPKCANMQHNKPKSNAQKKRF